MTIRMSLLLLVALLSGCAEDAPTALPGQLEWDRIAVPAEASEPLLDVAVVEGQTVEQGDLLARLDPRRADARLAEAEATLREREARLSELIHGARVETLDAARAELARAQASLAEQQREVARIGALRRDRLVAQADLDRVTAARDRAAAERRAVEARLRELTRGTREEQLAQAEAAVAAARASLETARIARERLDLRAPRAGRIDALPFDRGDQPPLGATVVSLLVGEAPYARVFVPTGQRATLREGRRFDVRIQGIDQTYAGELRVIDREPSFTPYYALSGEDASRLVYRAEIVLTDAGAGELPAGLPLSAIPREQD